MSVVLFSNFPLDFLVNAGASNCQASRHMHSHRCAFGVEPFELNTHGRLDFHGTRDRKYPRMQSAAAVKSVIREHVPWLVTCPVTFAHSFH